MYMHRMCNYKEKQRTYLPIANMLWVNLHVALCFRTMFIISTFSQTPFPASAQRPLFLAFRINKLILLCLTRSISWPCIRRATSLCVTINPQGPRRAAPHRAAPSRAEPRRAEPEPSRAEPSRAEPSRAEPRRTGPSQAEPEPSRAVPSREGQGRARPSLA